MVVLESLRVREGCLLDLRRSVCHGRRMSAHYFAVLVAAHTVVEAELKRKKEPKE